MATENELRRQLAALLSERQSHMDFADAVADFPEEAVNLRPQGVDYSFWHLVEHLRIAQRDILDYIEADDYRWPVFPDDYWPDLSGEAGPGAWAASVEAFLADRARLVEIVLDPGRDLFAPLPNSGERGHTIVREVHVVAAHNSYHTGELGILRGMLGLWPAAR